MSLTLDAQYCYDSTSIKVCCDDEVVDLKGCLKHYAWMPDACHDDVVAETGCKAEDDWLNHALAKLQDDRRVHFALEETRTSIKSEKTCGKPQSKVSRTSKTKSRVTKRPPPPSLCATHPSLYTQPPVKVEQAELKLESPVVKHERMSFDMPPQAQVKNDNFASLSSPTVDEVVPAWQSYSDPRRTTGFGEPSLYDATPRLLKSDVRSPQNNIISPMFMIPMPCGSLVELAQSYGPSF